MKLNVTLNADALWCSLASLICTIDDLRSEVHGEQCSDSSDSPPGFHRTRANLEAEIDRYNTAYYEILRVLPPAMRDQVRSGGGE